MKKVGKIITYDGRFGQIVDDVEQVDFSNVDFSYQENPAVGDYVVFRKETKKEGISLARNIKVLKNSSHQKMRKEHN